MTCRVKTCTSIKLHSHGLCNKHRKWVMRGYMTMNLVMLRPIKERNIYKNAKCSIEGCSKVPRRNWLCSSHSSRKDPEKLKHARAYAPDFACIVCGNTGKIVKGFCGFHYYRFRKGIIDYDGIKLRELRKVPKYGELDFCKVKGCPRRPRQRGWCATHRTSLLLGTYDTNGNRLVPEKTRNKGKTCNGHSCLREAHCKGLCTMHYYREKTGYLGAAGRKNKGQVCTETDCGKPAESRVLCSKHYRALLREEKKRMLAQLARTTTFVING